MPNPNPEGRVGLALILIGIVSAYVFLLYVWAGNPANPIVLAAIVIMLLTGWGLRKRFQPPKPPPGPNILMRWKSRIGGVGKKPAASALPKSGPPPERGPLDFLKPKPPKK